MQNRRINLTKGYADIPPNVMVLTLSDGIGEDVGVISDKTGELHPIVVVAGKSLRGLSVVEEDALVNEVVERLARYKEVKSKELPYPFGKTEYEYIKWNNSFRLGFFPLSIFETLRIADSYSIHEND